MTMPILAGFYPDPSICRVGEWCYLASSTFEYVPGVPIHRSRNLVDWELVGHALTDPAAINGGEGHDAASSGIFAPTLRHHDGLFWMITTSIRDAGRGQLIVHAEDPSGPWSAPVYVEGTDGIDPDLAWLEDGTCLLTWCGHNPPAIYQVEVDPRTGERLTDRIELWRGTEMKDTEGPHLFERDGWWYLSVAEGGTHVGHGASIARSRSPHGPFESNPANPILTHRSLPHPVQATGHPDLVELSDGSWAMVYLGMRPTGAYPGFHVNGRETFIAGVDWIDGWPVVDEGRFDVPDRDGSWDEPFVSHTLDARWLAPGKAPAQIATVTAAGLELSVGRDADAGEQLDLLCARIPAIGFLATAEVAAGDACLSVRMDARSWVGVERVGDRVRGRAVSGPFDQALSELDLRDGDLLAVRSSPSRELYGRLGPDLLEPGIVRDGAFVALGSVDGRYVSTEVAGGFTGRMLAIEALGGAATVRRMAYAEDPRD
ncbi:glycoside hydrolase family 43 protein [Demequina sp. SYSU T00039]|uniref:Glycoside hydrolase family 43 protein n=1 Tax=Demequina lignilytica TaxID=3051663 RepID=A0AAW7M5A2_9MICO|nr:MULTISPECIES: glycoside hydrolase family 43 protein [unclassified Demequina]MDN4477556.1 glycoside hydrolase family 43 protein [Demequina sp. SYSU T00039-1]MDN4488093.1 glycoside hydrolase family 43 protein [Demequina sp. SYSU T00039]MDN4490534.1 glycoside hydrolase family 43 protein [Demequina sp. SYSU T00068]